MSEPQSAESPATHAAALAQAGNSPVGATSERAADAAGDDITSNDGAVVYEMGFSAPQTAELVGITYRQLDHWARKGLIVPSAAQASGSGSRRRYTYNDLVELKIVKRMRDDGIDLKSISRSFNYLRNQLGAEVASSNIVISGNDVLLVDDDAVLSLVREGQATMFTVLTVAGLRRELDADVVKLFPDEGLAVQLSLDMETEPEG